MDKKVTITTELFDKVFPFHIAWKKDMNLYQVGSLIKKFLPELSYDQHLSNYFQIKSPIISYRFEEFVEQLDATFIFESNAINTLTLKGQVIYEKDEQLFIFLCNPIISKLNSLLDFGLHLSDFPSHNFITDFIFLINTKESLLRDAINLNERLSTTEIELKKINETLEQRVSERTSELKKREHELKDEIIVRKKAEKALLKMKNRAEDASSAKSQFIANMSHEIRTPLGAITGFNEILLNKSASLDLPDYFHLYLKYIKNSSEHLSLVINNILDISKIEARKSTLRIENINFHEFLQHIITTYSHVTKQKNINFIPPQLEQVPLCIKTDSVKLQQVLINLLENAIKFTPENKNIELKISTDNNKIKISITDEGIGIPSDQQAKIFDIFEQVDASNTRAYDGTGLGLAISKKLVELMKGTIKLESDPAIGSKFTVILPYEICSTKVCSPQKAEADLQFNSKNQVLLVEDNLINQKLVSAMIEDLNLKIQIANNGKEGISTAMKMYEEGQPPDLILMDLQMPVMGGVEAILNLNADDKLKHIPIVVISADAFTNQQEKVKNMGVYDYITKPINKDHLILVLKKYLEYSVQDSVM